MSKVARDLPLPDGSAGKWNQANPNANKPNGTLIRKIDDQPGPASSNPPSEGPSAVPMADIVPSRPITLPVFSLATASLAARAAIKPPSQGVAPHNAEATVNTPIPASIRRRRPIRSPNLPTLTISVACASVGKATLATLAPSAGSNIDTDRQAMTGNDERAETSGEEFMGNTVWPTESPGRNMTPCTHPRRSRHLAEGAAFALNTCTKRHAKARHHTPAVLRLRYGHPRPEPADHPGRPAGRRPRRSRRPPLAAKPVRHEPGAGAAARRHGRSAAGACRARSGAHAAGAGIARPGSRAGARRGSGAPPCGAAGRHAVGAHLQTAHQRRFCREFRSGLAGTPGRRSAWRAAALHAENR
ncbi:hypothetical protein G6F31_014527 [Rhizopus arrhizus]|nr:hypothetical protein G6F31_014527 [Rhizopus arrhizus]